jgi:putative flippase GtrA
MGSRPAAGSPVGSGLRARLAEAMAGEAFGQLLRFLVAGVGVTLFSAIIYTGCVSLGVAPMAANLVSHGCGMIVGYAVHSRWSFNADIAGGERAMIVRFLFASGFAFLLNSLWVWMAVDLLRLPPLAPLPAMMVLTPLCSFLLNRSWVFKAA